MSAPVTILPPLAPLHLDGTQPNELDLRRILRILKKRERYRYVTVNIAPSENGYRILSPCCSRNIAPGGNLIDIALIEYDKSAKAWALFSKVHELNEWRLHHRSGSLTSLVEYLIADPAKDFWQ